MNIRILIGGLALGLTGLASAVIEAAEPQATGATAATKPLATFTDSTAAGLIGTKRVAITSVVISFQAATGETKGGGFTVPIFGSKTTVQSVLAMNNMDPGLYGAIADAAYGNLQTQLRKAGYEVVPESQVKASANYQAIVKQAGYTNPSKFANAQGDILLVGPQSLPPYTAYQGEIGNFSYPSTTYLAWFGGFGGKSVTPGGPSITLAGNAWKVPGLEVALAKELNAHVVKAHYVVTLGKTTVKRTVDYVTLIQGVDDIKGPAMGPIGTVGMGKRVGGTAENHAQAALIPDQTHIAFRSPNGNAKWQKVSAKIVPPKDGDVVVRITDPVIGGTDWYSIERGEWERAGGLLFSAQKRADTNTLFLINLTDGQGYGQDLVRMIWLANSSMLGLIPAQ